jgi:D-alanine-D-alanine ligase
MRPPKEWPPARRTPPGAAVRAAAVPLGPRVFLKPSSEGPSVGVAPDAHEAAIDEAVRVASDYGGEMLMERMIVGDELTVPVLGDVALPSIRIVPRQGWYDYNAKYLADDTQYLCPGLEGAEEDSLRALALAAFRAAGCEGWGRVDVMRDRDGNLFLLEVNTAPGMTSHSLVPKAARQVGVEFEELCWRILEQTLEPRA